MSHHLKFVGIRDLDTFTPAAAILCDPVRLGPDARFLLRRAGWTEPGQPGQWPVILVRLTDGQGAADPYDWPSRTGDSRTMLAVHLWLIKHWDAHESGAIINVEFTSSETPTPKLSGPEGKGIIA